MGKISNYARVLKAKLQDVFVVDSTDNNVTTTKSVTVEQIGNAICGEQVHADLETDDQTIIGGINENKDKVGDLSTLTTTDKSSIVGAVNELNKTATIPFTGASGLSTNNCQIFKRGVFLVVCIEIVLTSDQSGWYDILTTDTDVTLPSGLSLFGVVSTDSESIMPKYCQAYQSGTKMKVRIRNGKAAGQYRGQIIVPLG